jgi:hypothetical protein
MYKLVRNKVASSLTELKIQIEHTSRRNRGDFHVNRSESSVCILLTVLLMLSLWLLYCIIVTMSKKELLLRDSNESR